jgi:enoyl-CoA hydratase/carnithine racemase
VNAKPSRFRCIILTGAGDKAFSAGGDLKERRAMTDEAWQDQHLIFERAARAFVACPVPVIGVVNGVAYGGGCEMALLCDFVYASEKARFALTEVTLGIMPGSAGTQTMPRAVGERRAMEIILTGTPFSAEQAYEWGLVNKVCQPPVRSRARRRGRAGDCDRHQPERADLGPPGEALHPLRHADGHPQRDDVRDRSL